MSHIHYEMLAVNLQMLLRMCHTFATLCKYFMFFKEILIFIYLVFGGNTG